MKKKRKISSVLALMVVGNYHIDAAQEEKKTGFLPIITTSILKPGLPKSSSQQDCVMLLDASGMQKLTIKPQIFVESSPEKKSPRYDRVPQSPVLFAAGEKIVASTVRSPHAGIRLVPLVSAQSFKKA